MNPSFPCNSPPTQAFDNPISFGLPSPFTLPSFPFGSTSSSTGLLSPSETMFSQIGEAPLQFLPEESEIFEDPCYVPDPVSLLGPVSESLDNFQLDLGFVSDSGLETPSSVKNVPLPAEINRPSPIESPMSRLRVSEERHTSAFPFPGTSKPQDLRHLPVDGLTNANDAGTWQMWNSSPLVHCLQNQTDQRMKISCILYLRQQWLHFLRKMIQSFLVLIPLRRFFSAVSRVAGPTIVQCLSVMMAHGCPKHSFVQILEWK